MEFTELYFLYILFVSIRNKKLNKIRLQIYDNITPFDYILTKDEIMKRILNIDGMKEKFENKLEQFKYEDFLSLIDFNKKTFKIFEGTIYKMNKCNSKSENIFNRYILHCILTNISYSRIILTDEMKKEIQFHKCHKPLNAMYNPKFTGLLKHSDLQNKKGNILIIPTVMTGKNVEHIVNIIKDVMDTNTLHENNTIYLITIYWKDIYEMMQTIITKHSDKYNCIHQSDFIISNSNKKIFTTGKIAGQKYDLYTISKKIIYNWRDRKI